MISTTGAMLPPIPIHIATRGHLDGQYGIATRGYLVLPDWVPRFPSDAIVTDERHLFGVVAEADQWASLEVLLEPTGVVAEIVDFTGLFSNGSLTAAVDGDILGLEAMLDDPGDLFMDLYDDGGPEAILDEDDLQAEVQDGGLAGELEEAADDVLTAEVEQRPGEGRCRG